MKAKMQTMGYLLIAIAVISFALRVVFSKVAVSNIGTWQLLFFTFLVATAVSLAAVLYKGRMGLTMKSLGNPREFATLAAAGILNFALAQLFLTLALGGTNPDVVSIVIKTWPLIFVLLAPFALKTKVAKGQYLAVLLGFAGAYLLATNGSVVSVNMAGLAFIGYALLNALVTALANILIKRQSGDMLSHMLIFNASSFIFVAAYLLLTGQTVALNLNTAAIESILFLGIGNYFIASAAFFTAIRMFDSLLAVTASDLVPALTIVASFLMLGTPIETYYLYALALIMAGLALQRHYAAKAPVLAGNAAKRLFDVTGAFVNNTNAKVYDYLRENGKALAVLAKGGAKEAAGYSEHDGYVLMTSEDHNSILNEGELEFIRELVGAGNGDVVLVGVGNPEKVEEALQKEED